MPAPPLAALVRRAAPDPSAVPDADLLGRYARDGDPAAFELLVWRHGAVVWGVCRRVLRHDHDAEDACQAAFVALAAHAGRLRDHGALAAWLHRVAVRAALDLLAARTRPGQARPLADDRPAPGPDPARAAADREAVAILDEGLNRLPDRLRVPFVLCELGGRTNAEAAAVLGCPVGTVESRLTRARQRLREWLSARGVAPAVAVAAVAVPDAARAAMTRAAVAGAVGPAVRALAARAAGSAARAKVWGVVAAGLLAVSAVGLGLTPGDAPKAGDPPPPKPAAAERDPLPVGVIARLGSPQLRHGAWVKGVAYSPDGKRIASVGYDKALRVWDAATGEQLFTVKRSEGQFDAVTFADGGSVVVVGLDKQRAGDLWRVAADGTVLGTLASGLTHSAEYVARFNPDGSRVALADLGQKKFVVADTTTGKPIWSIATTPLGAAFTPDGATVAMTTTSGEVRLFDAATGNTGAVIKEDNARLTTVAFSPDGKMVVANDTKSSSAIAWQRASGLKLWKTQVPADVALLFTPDSKTLIWASRGYAPTTLDPADGVLPGISGRKGTRFESMIGVTCAALHPNGKVVAFGCISGPVCLYDIATGKLVAPSADPPHEVRWMRFSADSKTLYGWAADWHAWDIATGVQARVTNAGWCYGEPLSPDGKYTARSVWYSGLRIQGNPDDGTRFEVLDARSGSVVRSVPGQKFRASWTDFTPDGQAIVGATHDGKMAAWSLDTLKELWRVPGHSQTPQYHAFSANGRVLVTATGNDPPEAFPVRVWDLKTGEELAKFNPEVRVCGLAASGDGRRVAAVVYTNSAGKPDARELVTVWDVTTGKVLARVPQGGDGGHVALSPDGRLVAVAARWKVDVRVFEVASGAERFTFRHAAEVTGLTFSPNGKVLAAASQEAPIYLWDVAGARAAAPPAWDADRAWDDLAANPTKGFAAIRQLRANPAQAVALLKERAKLPATPDAATLKGLLADLASEDFKTREKATAALAGYGEVIRSALTAEADRSSSPEARARLGRLLERLDAMTPARRRLVRAVEAVEGMATPEAAELLREWASGSCGAALAAEATAALARSRK